MYDGIDMTGVRTTNPAMDWAFADRVRKSWKGKFLIKGMDTREDARLCVEHGIDGILVSNHGGRSLDDVPATITVLPRIAEAVRGRIPIVVDGGIRRGQDAFKALALGATAVALGRPIMYSLALGGWMAVQQVLEQLNSELQAAMRHTGIRNIAEITRKSITV